MSECKLPTLRDYMTDEEWNDMRKDKWVKCTDRLPSKEGYYLCTYIFDNHRFYYDRWFNGHEFSSTDNITHWMELPDAPK